MHACGQLVEHVVHAAPSVAVSPPESFGGDASTLTEPSADPDSAVDASFDAEGSSDNVPLWLRPHPPQHAMSANVTTPATARPRIVPPDHSLPGDGLRARECLPTIQ
jgi:hypothetical protein